MVTQKMAWVLITVPGDQQRLQRLHPDIPSWALRPPQQQGIGHHLSLWDLSDHFRNRDPELCPQLNLPEDNICPCLSQISKGTVYN